MTDPSPWIPLVLTLASIAGAAYIQVKKLGSSEAETHSKIRAVDVKLDRVDRSVSKVWSRLDKLVESDHALETQQAVLAERMANHEKRVRRVLPQKDWNSGPERGSS